MTSVIIPVFNESGHLPQLISAICRLQMADKLEVIVVDDSYDDLTAKSIGPFFEKMPLTIIRRHKRLGLASAVMAGFDKAESDILVCMDGDGSHPPETIALLVEKIAAGEPMAVASRNVPGGGVSGDYSLMRKIISKICTVLVKPLTTLRDPMSGYFAVSAAFYQKVRPRLKPLSYKIALELAVKGDLKNIPEMAFQFEKRQAGSSKVNLTVVLGMIHHFFALYCWRFLRR